MKYKYLLWDIDGTILNFKAAEKVAIKKLFVEFEYGQCTDEMIDRYSKINAKYWEALERNEMTKNEILVARFYDFFKGEGIDTSRVKEFNKAYQVALGDTVVFNDDAYNLLLEEKRSGYILIAVTNGTKIAQKKKLSLSKLDGIFDYVFISEEIGYEKPNKEFFYKVFDVVNINNLEDVLIIGDSLTSDIKGGINASIDTCWYNPDSKVLKGDIIPKYIISNLEEIERYI